MTLVKFLMVPASLRHHHAHQHGLFIHSIEVAEQLYQTNGLEQTEKELLIIAGLYHDIGKTMTMTIKGEYTGLGSLVNHDSLTLEVCSNAFSQLDLVAPSLSNEMRHIWCRNHQYGYKHPALARLISHVDRQSAVQTSLNAP